MQKLLFPIIASLFLVACGSDDATDTASTSTGGSPDAGAGGSSAGAGGASAGTGGTKGGAGGAGGTKAGAGGSSAGAAGAQAGAGGQSGTGGTAAGQGGTSAGAGGDTQAGAGGTSAGAGGDTQAGAGGDAGAGGSTAGAGGGAGGSGPSCADLGGQCVSTDGPPDLVCPGGTLQENPSCPSSPLPGGGHGCCIPGGAAGSGGAGGAAGAAGSGEGGNCPDSPPTAGSLCSVAPGTSNLPTCSYGDNVRVSCREQYTCTSGQWEDMTTGTICPLPGENGCPAAPPESGASCTTEVSCGFPDGTVCSCEACHGGACMPDAKPTWACGGPPTTPGCPGLQPNAGAACALDPSVTCMYPIGGCGGYFVTCQDGSWAWQELLCP